MDTLQKIPLHSPRSLVERFSPNNTPRNMTNSTIVLDFVPPPLRYVKISELIYTYKDCTAQNFTPPAHKQMVACANSFVNVMTDMDMDIDNDDTRYLGGTHPKYNLTLPEHYSRCFPESQSRLHRCKSLFSKNMCEYYISVGIEARYFANWTAYRIKQKSPTPFIPTNEIDIITDKAEAARFDRPNIYLAYLLAYGMGLRRSEIVRAKWSDLYETRDGNKLIRIWQPKSIKRAKPTDFEDRPCDPTYWNKLQDMRGSASSDTKIVNTAIRFIPNSFNSFLKDECGITETHRIHLLRKYCGHRIMRSDGIYPASKALGHADTNITDKIYSGMPQLKAS